MSSTTTITILQRSDVTETKLTMPNIDATTKISAFIPMLLSFLQKPVYRMKCLFPNGTLVEYPSKDYSKIIDEKDDFPVYELTHHGKHSIRIRTFFDTPFPLRIKFPDAKIITVDVSLSDTLSKLRDIVASQAGLESEQLLFYHNGKQLVLSKTLYEYSITSKDIVDVISQGKQDHSLPITLSHSDGRKCQVFIGLSDTGSSLQKIASEKFGIPKTHVLLLYGGRHIEPNQSLNSVGLISNARILVTAAVPGGGPDDLSVSYTPPLPILLAHVDGRECQAFVDLCDTGSSLQKITSEKFGIPTRSVLLIYEGHHIMPDQPLSSIGLVKNSRVMVAAVVPGGRSPLINILTYSVTAYYSH